MTMPRRSQASPSHWQIGIRRPRAGPRKARALLEDLPDCEGYLVSKDLDVTRTSGFGRA